MNKMLKEEIGTCIAAIESFEKELNLLSKQLENRNQILSQKSPVLEQLKTEREKLREKMRPIGFFKFKERKPIKRDIAAITKKFRKIEKEATEEKNAINNLKQQETELLEKLQTTQQKKDELEKEAQEIQKAEQGDPNAQFNLGIKLMEKNNFHEAKQWFEKSFHGGNSAALWKYHFCTRRQEGVRGLYNINEYIKRASQGSLEDQYLLGCAYKNGFLTIEDGTVKILEECPDLEKSVEWLNKAAEQGSEYAAAQLAENYIFGWGVDRDAKTGMSMLLNIAKNGRRSDVRYDAQAMLEHFQNPQNRGPHEPWWAFI
jgi:tetratricopeptide (TPR) repeat protein